MKIVVPMAGKGKRFDDYLSPKPLMDIGGKAMIEHAISFLPQDYEFIFLCNEDHLKETNMKEVLENAVPDKKIVSIPNHSKGPSYSSLFALEHIKDEEEVLVTYCDTIQVCDFYDFLKKIRTIRPDGALFSFKGFHPASLGETYYGYLRVDENNFLQELREKQNFTDNRLNEFASSGVYYFASGKIFKQYVKELISNELNAVKGEFYSSVLLNLMVRDNLKVLNYEIDKFISLGIPRDYELYKFWSEVFLDHSYNKISFDNINLNVTNVFPVAGESGDFIGHGFDGPNFALPIMNKSLIHHAFKSNPRGVKNMFIGLQEHKEYFKNIDLFSDPDSQVVLLNEKTRGNAETIYKLKDLIDLNSPLCISGSTQILDFNEKKMLNLMEKEDVDIIFFSFSHHECVLRDPNDFAYFRLKNNVEVEEIVEKKAISDKPYFDHAFAGVAIFKKAKDLFDSIENELTKANGGKIYYSTCINNILRHRKAVVFEIDKFLPIRNPGDLKEFLYWEEYFNRAFHHPYKKENSNILK
jgi:NDP-sugar pyrophosphorylase family protein